MSEEEMKNWILKQKHCWMKNLECFNISLLMHQWLKEGRPEQELGQVGAGAHFAKYDVYNLRREGKW